METGSKEPHMFFVLLWSFSKIGVFTFGGGYAMIPLIEKELIDRRHWIERERFLELLTLAQSAPGPIALNAAVFVGYHMGKYRGAVAAALGVILPSFVILLLIAIFFTGIKDNPVVEAVFKGMRPAVVSLIAAPVFYLARGMGYVRIGLSVLVAVAVWHLGVSPVAMIILGALGGIAWTVYKSCKTLGK